MIIDLFKKTNAYKIIESDKEKNLLSHAYLFICQDYKYLREYLKMLAGLIMSYEGERAYSLIMKENYADAKIYPKVNKGIVVADAAEILEDSLIKPLENNKKLFILSNCENMNTQTQNKLLKVLEEPPKNVIFILGSVNEFSLLPTVKSRVKKIEISPYNKLEILEYLNDKYGDKVDLELIAEASLGMLGLAEDLAEDIDFSNIENLAFDLTANMNSATDILEYSEKINNYSKKIKQFLSILKIIFRDMMFIKLKQNSLIINTHKMQQLNLSANNYDIGGIIYAIKKINSAEQDLFFNANMGMLIESLLFSIMEGKFKWQKL